MKSAVRGNPIDDAEIRANLQELYLMKETNLTLEEIYRLPAAKVEAYIIMLNEQHKCEGEYLKRGKNARNS